MTGMILLYFENVQLAADSVRPILDAVEAFAARYVVLPKHARVVVALWVAHAHVLEAFDAWRRAVGVTCTTSSCTTATPLPARAWSGR
mgnify:CR=1 FL=1